MMEDALTHHIALAAVISYVMEWAKRSNLVPFFSQYSDSLNKAIGFLAAFISAAGIEAQMTGNLSMHTGATITLTIPSLSIVVETLMHTMGQWAIQQGVYHGLIKQSPASNNSPAPQAQKVAA